MSPITALSVDYDAGTKRHGASGMTYLWHQILKDLCAEADQINLPRQNGSIIAPLAEAIVGDAVRRGNFPLMFGGDHSLSWYALRPLTDRFGPLTIVHFDAHHDAYNSHVLNHYTVFHHVKRLLPVKITQVGVRHDGYAPDTIEDEITGPCYVSVDVDYFHPDLVPSVVHAVAPAVDSACDLVSFRTSLARIKGPILGADIVEWMGAARGTAEYDFVREVVSELLAVVEKQHA